jgi:hypothetical protein
MTTPQEYRQFADECLQWAREAKTDGERQQFPEMANASMQAAALQDGKLPIASPSAP